MVLLHGLPFVTIVVEPLNVCGFKLLVVDWLCEEDIDRFIVAVPTYDPPIGEGAVLFGSFGDLVVLSKKRIA